MSLEETSENSENLWLAEIIRETEHYYQGEIQQEQRASWILATVSVLLALMVGAQLQLENGLRTPLILITITQISFYLSGIFAVLTIIPLRGTRIIRWDFFGQSFRHYKSMDVEEMIERKFQHGETFPREKYKKRLFYHFRAHFLRVRLKEYGVVWSSFFLLLGFIFLGLVGLIEFL
jgi:hypothetical protein